MEKNRLDTELVNRQLATGRDKAKGIIMAGQVFVNNQKTDKPGFQVSSEDKIEVRGEQLPFVSRGGLKLDKAIKSFGLNLSNQICADFGASTGGFTDCMLQNGAVKVYSVDVGYGQLAWKLRTDNRVINLERKNVRYITENEIPDPLDFASVDLSFISLKHVFPILKQRLSYNSMAVCLVKPQFEAGREFVGKKGVVREASTHIYVINHAIEMANENNLSTLNIDYSPIKGPEGNIEFLLLVQNKEESVINNVSLAVINNIVEKAHKLL